MIFVLTPEGLASAFQSGNDTETLALLGVSQDTHVIASDCDISGTSVIVPSEKEREALCAACDWDVTILRGEEVGFADAQPVEDESLCPEERRESQDMDEILARLGALPGDGQDL